MKNRATLHVGGLTRTYIVHLPVAYTPERTYPLVLAFHGRGTTASWMARRTHLNRVADEHHFLVVWNSPGFVKLENREIERNRSQVCGYLRACSEEDQEGQELA